ncbi:two-component sensor histidine kinase [Thalassospira lohafexi]|uniref:histidine kinase n=2 Tax=Thalassospira lohafexi TaxID=744227 RepID=A0A2N3L1P1_9PROT|nr:two-component sensor histidine kinase [Thalassospira lohafexi]
MRMFSTKSLQFALTKRLTVMVGVFWIAGSLLADFTMYHEMQEVFDSSLVKSAYRYAPLMDDYLKHHGRDTATVVVESPEQGENKTGDRGEGDDEIGADYLMYQVRDVSGRLLLRSANAEEEPFSAPLLEGFYTDDHFRIYSAVVKDGARIIQIAEPLSHRREALIASVSAQFLPIIVLIPAVIIGIIFAVRQGLQPVRRVRDDIEARSEGNLAPIEQDDAPDEIHTMITAVNRLMEKLDAALRAERTFTAHSAHELRTPIAAALAQTQRLLLELPADHPGLKRAQQTEESLKRLSRLSEKLLQLARAEAGVGTSPTGKNQKLGTTLGLVIDDLERVSDGAGRIEWDGKNAAALNANIDVDAFAICLRNLIENALKHGDENQPVVIEIKGSNVIRVSNGGDVVDPRDMTELTARFKRAQTKARGAGLGLSIVETIMQNTGGKLTLSSPRPDHVDGFMAELWLHQS